MTRPELSQSATLSARESGFRSVDLGRNSAEDGVRAEGVNAGRDGRCVDGLEHVIIRILRERTINRMGND